MNDIKKTREANLRAVIDEVGSLSAVAKAAGTDPNYLSQILSPSNSASLGGSLARRIEAAYLKPKGWMDTPHDMDESRIYGIIRKDTLHKIAADLKGEYLEDWEGASVDEAAVMLRMLIKIHGGLDESTPTTGRKPESEAE